MNARSRFFFLVLLLVMAASGFVQAADEYVREACSVTRYRDLCVHSLAAFSGSAKRSPYRWARAAVSVTLAEAKSVQLYLSGLERSRGAKGRTRLALSDCVECFGDAVAELHRSLAELRRLTAKTFAAQMGDVETWVSAALTNADTCLEGFAGGRGSLARSLSRKAVNATRFASNALALLNQLAAAGGGGEAFSAP